MIPYKKTNKASIKEEFERAAEFYSRCGVDAEAAIKTLENKPVSLHCWQGDDVGGFESSGADTGGGIMATGNYPGKARNAEELRRDIEKVFSLTPGKRRLNLHAIYLENHGKKADRDAVAPEHFEGWMQWAEDAGARLDFNPTFFAHPMASDGFTLSHRDKTIRSFWIEHAKRCREIASVFARRLGGPSIVNLWIPDGMKDFPADRWSPRARLAESLDEIFRENLPGIKDALESKLFGIGSEEYVVGSSEYYLAYAVSKGKMTCMDMGHYHPTEALYDKLSAVLAFLPEVLLHLSRPVRWDSDHVVILNDDLINLFHEIIRGNALEKVHLATDFFDAGINRIGAWVIGARSAQKALLSALLSPVEMLRKLENEGLGAEKLALMEEAKWFPVSDVWSYYCMRSGVPAGPEWINEITEYQSRVLSERK